MRHRADKYHKVAATICALYVVKQCFGSLRMLVTLDAAEHKPRPVADAHKCGNFRPEFGA